MDTVFNWRIETLETNVEDGGVITAHWRCTGIDGDYSGSAYGTAGFQPDPSDRNFIPYDQLTQDKVLEWVWASEEGDFKLKVERAILQKIEADKTPVTKTGVPW